MNVVELKTQDLMIKPPLQASEPLLLEIYKLPGEVYDHTTLEINYTLGSYIPTGGEIQLTVPK